MKNTHLYVLVAVLALVSLSVFAYKHWLLGFPLAPDERTQFWDFEVRARFSALGKPVKFRMQIPSRGNGYTIIDESFFSGRYGLSTRYVDGNREAVWSIRSTRGKQTLIYRGTIQAVAGTPPAAAPAKPPATPGFAETELEVAKSFLERAREHSADTETLVSYVLDAVNDREPDSDVALLFGDRTDRSRQLGMVIKVLALAGLRAEVVNGVPLTVGAQNIRPLAWLEVSEASGAQMYDTETGDRVSNVPFLVLWRGSGELVALTGGRDLDVTPILRPAEHTAIAGLLLSPQSDRHWLVDYSLFSLPVTTQAVFRIVLTIPLGVLVLVLLRNVVGFKTFGTFMPVLVALSFRGTELVAGIAFFAIIVALGLTVRFYLEHLKLVLVPRLASVLIVVVLLMAAVTMVSYKLGIATGLSVSLFPMVVQTMVIERMAIVWEERGAGEAMQQALGSILVASLAYLVMTYEPLVHLVFLYPELLLLILCCTLLLGRYSGYRLLELRRFKALAGG